MKNDRLAKVFFIIVFVILFSLGFYSLRGLFQEVPEETLIDYELEFLEVSTEQAKEARKNFILGKGFFKERNFEEAIIYNKKSIYAFQTKAAYLHLYFSYYSIGNYEKAEQALLAGLDIQYVGIEKGKELSEVFDKRFIVLFEMIKIQGRAIEKLE